MKKKMSLLLLAVIMVGVLTGCGKTKIEDQTATCTKQASTHHETITLSGTNGKVSRFDAVYKYEPSVFGADNLDNVTEEQKQEFINNMYTNLGFEKDKTYDGFNIKVEVEDKVIVTYGGDVNNTSAQTELKKLGIDFSNADLTFENAVDSYKTSGYTCK